MRNVKSKQTEGAKKLIKRRMKKGEDMRPTETLTALTCTETQTKKMPKRYTQKKISTAAQMKLIEA